MEKYAVETVLDKLASSGCPLCGRELEQHGMVTKCPEHGTEPFEHERNKASNSTVNKGDFKK
jgi:DNA repair exonuclease SbcCD ATPase subunit